MQVLRLAAVVALASACAAPPAKKAPPPPEIDVLTLRPTELRETGEYLGHLVSRQSVTILPQVAGYVRKIHVKPGDRVEPGTELLEVDAREENAALNTAEAQVRSAESSLELARQTAARTEALHKEGLVSAQELERAAAAAASAEAALRAASSQAALRRVQVQYHIIRAPFAGVVGEVPVKLGDFVTAATPLTSVAQAEVLEVTIAIPPDKARRIGAGTTLELVDAAGAVLVAAPVVFVAPQTDPRTQLVDVKAVFDNALGLRPAELVRTRIVYSTKQALQVPPLAVVWQSGQGFVFVVAEKEGKTIVERRPVGLGPLGETSYPVVKGLAAGDRIAVSQLQKLRDGAPVVVKPEPSPTQAAVPPPVP